MLDLVLLPDDYAVCRLDPGTPVPTGLDAGKGVVSVTWTEDEISIICPASQAPTTGTVNAPWRCFQVTGPLDLALTGIMAALVTPLADARVNVFVFSTYETDYVLVPAVRLDEAHAALTAAGHRITIPTPGSPPPRTDRPSGGEPAGPVIS
ncbi:MAG: ACT domain-containing protein [Dactylosporangium sp.]|nr:ACT domain-containing protein [Dactylosporangium sp.]